MASHDARRELALPRAIAHLHSWVASGKTRSDLDRRFPFLCMLAL